jgi:post-segregation antitoxin (ccd killing protein)
MLRNLINSLAADHSLRRTATFHVTAPAVIFILAALTWKQPMNLTVQIPDDVAERLRAAGGDLSRRALEALVAEEYRQGHLTKPDLRRLLGLETSDQIDGFLKAHEVWIDYSLKDLERERAGLERLGL